MEVYLTGESRTFYEELRQWVADNAPAGLSSVEQWNMSNSYRAYAHPLYLEWERKVVDARLVFPQYPKEQGGLDWTPWQTALWAMACHDAKVPTIERGIGELVGACLIELGTEDQRKRFLPRLISGEDKYCQGFSEPDHGSDLAAVQTRGVIDGDEIVITGQKTWTSGGLSADMMFTVVRTDPSAPKHKGLTMVIIPMKSANLEVRPIRALDGFDEFSEEFLDEVRIPLANIVGEVNKGWQVAMTALAYERGVAATTSHHRFEGELDHAVELARRCTRSIDPSVRERLAWACARFDLIRWGNLKKLSRMTAGDPPGANEAAGKIVTSEFRVAVAEVAADLDPSFGLIRPEGDGYRLNDAQDLYLTARSEKIHSGSNEIQRNIVAERVLGLPRDPKPAAVA